MRARCVLFVAAACLCALGLSGCFAIPVDPSPETYYAQNASDPAKLAKLGYYQQRFLCVGFYPGIRAAAMHDWSTGQLVSESFITTALNVCTFLIPTIISWPTECGSSYTDYSFRDHTGWFAFLGYFKTYDPGPSESELQALREHGTEAGRRLRGGEPFLDVARDLASKSGIGMNRSVLYLYKLSAQPASPAAVAQTSPREEGLRFLKEGDYARAVERLREAVRLAPNDPGCHSDLGACLLRAGLAEESLASFDSALALDPKHSEARSHRGMAYAKLGRLEDAVRDFSVLVNEHPSAEAYLLRGGILIESGDCERGLPDIQECIRLNPKLAEAHYARGLCRVRANQLGPAIADFTEAIRWRQDYVEAYHNRATAYALLGSPDAAMEDMNASIGIRPTPESLVGRGTLHAAAGDEAKAIADFDQALALRPGFGPAHYQRGISYLRQGDRRKAREDLTKARALGVAVDASVWSELEPQRSAPPGGEPPEEDE